MSTMTFSEVCSLVDSPDFYHEGTKVFLDLDGLIADLVGHTEVTAGRPLITPGCWSMDFDFNGQSFDWWMALKPTDEAQACLSMLERDNVYVCTARPSHTPSAMAAYAWLVKLAPWLPADRVIICPKKQLLAKPGRILVDDADHNIDDWIKAGGTGCLMPRRWNSRGKDAP